MLVSSDTTLTDICNLDKALAQASMLLKESGHLRHLVVGSTLKEQDALRDVSAAHPRLQAIIDRLQQQGDVTRGRRSLCKEIFSIVSRHFTTLLVDQALIARLCQTYIRFTGNDDLFLQETDQYGSKQLSVFARSSLSVLVGLEMVEVALDIGAIVGDTEEERWLEERGLNRRSVGRTAGGGLGLLLGPGQLVNSTCPPGNNVDLFYVNEPGISAYRINRYIWTGSPSPPSDPVEIMWYYGSAYFDGSFPCQCHVCAPPQTPSSYTLTAHPLVSAAANDPPTLTRSQTPPSPLDPHCDDLQLAQRILFEPILLPCLTRRLCASRWSARPVEYKKRHVQRKADRRDRAKESRKELLKSVGAGSTRALGVRLDKTERLEGKTAEWRRQKGIYKELKRTELSRL